MKIALINENSQNSKNPMIEAALKKVVEPMGHTVFNYGMYADADSKPLTYVQNGILAAVLLNSDEEAVGKMLQHPYANIALSDAGAHLTFFCDAGFGLHLLGHWVRGRKVMPLERAIHHLTGRPARIFGIQDRGTLQVGIGLALLAPEYTPGTQVGVQVRRNVEQFEVVKPPFVQTQVRSA